jgi:acetyl-CoA synthetase/acetyltransferase
VERARIVRGAAGRESAVRHVLGPSPAAPGTLSDQAAKRLLRECAFPLAAEDVVGELHAALEAAERLAFPVVLKVAASEIPHKTEVGGVVVGIRDADALADAWHRLRSRFPTQPLLMQELVRGDVELILGGWRDAEAGAVVMIGVGGIFAETLHDVAFARAPVTRERALAAVGRLESQALLDGVRGRSGIDRETVAELMERLSAVLVANEWISEVDLNPVIVSGARAVVVDALVRGV